MISRCPEIFGVRLGIINWIDCFYDAELRPTFYLARYHYYILAEETALRLYGLLLRLKDYFMFLLIVISHLNQFDAGSMMYQAIWYLQPRKHHTFTDWVKYQNVEIFLHKSCKSKFFQFEIIINVFVSSFRFIWIPILWFYDYYKYFYSFSAHNFLTYIYGPRTERFKTCIMTVSHNKGIQINRVKLKELTETFMMI